MNFIGFFKKTKQRFITQGKKREEMQTAMNRPQDPQPPSTTPTGSKGGSRYNQIKGAIQQDSHCSDCVYLH